MQLDISGCLFDLVVLGLSYGDMEIKYIYSIVGVIVEKRDIEEN